MLYDEEDGGVPLPSLPLEASRLAPPSSPALEGRTGEDRDGSEPSGPAAEEGFVEDADKEGFDTEEEEGEDREGAALPGLLYRTLLAALSPSPPSECPRGR